MNSKKNILAGSIELYQKAKAILLPWTKAAAFALAGSLDYGTNPLFTVT